MAFSAGHFSKQPYLPEPWSSSDSQTLDDLLSATDWELDFGVGLPRFLIDYENLTDEIPDALQSNHVRSSVATRWDSNGDLVEDPADTPRLQRDPATGDVLGLLYEPKRTQVLTSPRDLTGSGWGSLNNSSVSTKVGSAKGLTYQKLQEDSTSGFHTVATGDPGTTSGTPVSSSFILKADGRSFVYQTLRLFDSGTSTSENIDFFFDLSNGTVGTTDTVTNGSLIDHSISDLGGGWYRINVSVNPSSDFAFIKLTLGLGDADNSKRYTGDGSSGVLFLHAQAEKSREVTSPILTGGAVREADEVDYRFDFPDKTTGVAYSIKQEKGDDYPSVGYVDFGPTSDGFNEDHGVLMYNIGLNNILTDGYKQVTRNSNDADTNGLSPKNETIDRFKVGEGSEDFYPIHVIRQIAIHTRPHTAKQLSDLKSNYLTTP